MTTQTETQKKIRNGQKELEGMSVKINKDINIYIRCGDIELEQIKIKDKLCDKCKDDVDVMVGIWDRFTDTWSMDDITIDDIENCVWGNVLYSRTEDDGCYDELYEEDTCNEYLEQILNLELVKWKLGGYYPFTTSDNWGDTTRTIV